MVAVEKSTYSLEDFLTLVDEAPELTAVTVAKERYGFSVDGVICEYAEVFFNGAMIETACVESTDYGVIEKVVNKLELAEFENTNYLKAAKQVIGML